MPHHHHKDSLQHSHSHTPNTTFRLMATMILNFIITIAEIIGGVVSGSLSLISDALHNFSDGISVIISYIAIKLKYKKHSYRHTFGLKRAEILAAVINSSVLIVISIYLFWEAYERLMDPQPIKGGLMMIVAAIGLIANVIGVLLLERDSHESINIKSAYLHLFSDAVSSLGVLIGGFAIYKFNIYWIDPVLTVLIGLYIIKESIEIMGQAIHVLMEGAPSDISIKDITAKVEKITGVVDIHHIHIWNVGENDIHFQAHINVDDIKVSETKPFVNEIEHLLLKKFKINHVTIQFENECCKNVGPIHEGE